MTEVYQKNQAKKPKKKSIIFFVVALVLLIVAAGVYYGYKKMQVASVDQSDVVAEVGGEKIYLKEYKERLFAASGGLGSPIAPIMYEATEAIKEPILNELVDLRIVKKELAKRNIAISESDINQEAKNVFKDYDSRDTASQKAYKDYVRLKVGKNKLLEKVASWKEGYVLYCYFDRYDQDDTRDKPEAAGMKIKQEIYAKEYCTKVKERLETGKSNYQDELAKLTADPEIGEASWKPYKMPFGKEIVKDKFSSKYFHPAYNILNRLSSLSDEKNKFYFLTMKDEPSAVKEDNDATNEGTVTSESAETVKVSTDNVTNKDKEAYKSQETKDAMYAVVYIKEGNNGETTDFDQWLQDRQKDYKVKTYIERIKI